MTLPLPLPSGAANGDGNGPATPWDLTEVTAGGPDPWAVTIAWSISSGRAEPAAVQAHSPGGRATRTALAAVPAIIRTARQFQAACWEAHAAVIASYGDTATAAPFLAAAAASRKGLPGPGRPVDTEQLQDAADAWKKAPRGGKRAAVAKATFTGSSGAAKLIARARKAGLLDPPAPEGR